MEEKPDRPGERGRDILASYFRVLRKAGKLTPRTDAADDPASASAEQDPHDEPEATAEAVRFVLERLPQPRPTTEGNPEST